MVGDFVLADGKWNNTLMAICLIKYNFKCCNVFVDSESENEETVNPLDEDFEDQLREQSENYQPIKNTCDFLGTDKQGRPIIGIYASRFPEKSQLEGFVRYVQKKLFKGHQLIGFMFSFL